MIAFKSNSRRDCQDLFQALQGHQASEHREVAQVMQSLHAQSLPLVEDGVVWISISEQIVWESILQSFLHAHEKHDTFTMLHLKAGGLSSPVLKHFSIYCSCTRSLNKAELDKGFGL